VNGLDKLLKTHLPLTYCDAEVLRLLAAKDERTGKHPDIDSGLLERMLRRRYYTIGEGVEYVDNDVRRYSTIIVNVCTMFLRGQETDAFQRHVEKLRDIHSRTSKLGGIQGNLANVLLPLAVIDLTPQRVLALSYPHVRAIVEDHDPGNRWNDARTIRPCIDIATGQYDDTQR
jgi:hypothetical protein